MAIKGVVVGAADPPSGSTVTPTAAAFTGLPVSNAKAARSLTNPADTGEPLLGMNHA